LTRASSNPSLPWPGRRAGLKRPESLPELDIVSGSTSLTSGSRARWFGWSPRCLASLALMGGLVAFGALSAALPPAFAAGCEGQKTRIVQAFPNKNGRGTKVSGPGMHVFASQVECVRISIIANINSSGQRFVELGWFEDATGLLRDCPRTDGSPHVLRYSYFDGTVRCDNATAPLSGGTDQDFWVQDANQNGVWTYYRNGNSIGAYDMGSFVAGTPVAQGERRVLTDSARTDHHGLKRMINNTDYTGWEGTSRGVDNDEDFRACIRSNMHVEVKESC
jgi:hypothetical protein